MIDRDRRNVAVPDCDAYHQQVGTFVRVLR